MCGILSSENEINLPQLGSNRTGGTRQRKRYEGCIFLFVPLAIYFAESAALFLTGGDILHILPGNGELFFQHSWLGVVLFPPHAVWVLLMCALV